VSTAGTIRAKVEEIARGLGHNPRNLSDDMSKEALDPLDSAAILELIMWCEGEFGIEIPQEELSLDNFGSIRRMTDFIEARRS